MKSVFAIWVCSLLAGCSGLTLGPTVERQVIVVRAGTAIEVLDSVEVEARVLTEEGAVFQQNIGGWIAMHPDHWEAVKREITRLRGE